MGHLDVLPLMRTINKDRAGPAHRFYLIKSPSKETKGLKKEGLAGARASCTPDWAKFISKAEEMPGFKAVGVGDLPWPPRATPQSRLHYLFVCRGLLHQIPMCTCGVGGEKR